MSADGHDQWHQHTTSEEAPQQEHTAQASAKALGLTFIAMTLGVLFVIIVLVVYFRSYMSNYESQINENTDAAAVTWQYKEEKLNALKAPVAGAIDQVVAEYAQN